jgi:sugar lactone lactonase YvrE
MNNRAYVLSSFLMLLLGLAACGAPKVETELPAPPTKIPTVQAVKPSPIPKQPDVVTTRIEIDGDPSDWENYDVLSSDPEGDHEGGGFDIAALRAITNDKYLYVLIETHMPRSDYVQLDLVIEADESTYVVSMKPEEGGQAVMGDVTGGGFISLGDIDGSISAAFDAVEFKMPLAAFGEADRITLKDVRPMGGECCDQNWYAIDDIVPTEVAKLSEVEPSYGDEEEVQPIQICSAEIASPQAFGAFEPAPVQFSQPGYAAEWFVTPATFNMPQDVLVTPQGDILVLGTRNFALFRVTKDGAVTTLVERVYGYTSDVDAQGNVYIYSHPDGRITRVSPDGNQTVVIESQTLITDCTSGLGIGPDGYIYAARSLCDKGSMDNADLYRISMSGQMERVAEKIPALFALKTDSNGRFIAAAMGDVLHELSLSDFSFSPIGNVPGHDGVAVNGLTADTAGNLYVSTGTWSPSGQVYQFDAQGNFNLIADIPGNGLSGIEWVPETGELLGVQLQLGALISVASDGSLRTIVPGNGLITPRGIAFSPCGELAVSNEDGGMMALIDPAGRVRTFFEYISYTSPISFMAFDRDGELFVTEGAPGFPERIIHVLPGDSMPEPLVDVARPGGIALRSDGVLFVAETIADRIAKVDVDGTVSVFADGLSRPTALGLDAIGDLYAVIGTCGRPLDPVHMPDAGDTIVRFSPDGEASELANWSTLTGLAFAPSGDLFAGTGWDGGIVRISPTGKVTSFASGMQEVSDLAFDVAGNLYASDTVLNGIVRISGFDQGELSGIVTDQAGSPIEGVQVHILSSSPVVVGQILFTDADGQFSLTAAPRSYEVTVMAEGVGTALQESVEVVADQETAIEIVLGE